MLRCQQVAGKFCDVIIENWQSGNSKPVNGMRLAWPGEASVQLAGSPATSFTKLKPKYRENLNLYELVKKCAALKPLSCRDGQVLPKGRTCCFDCFFVIYREPHLVRQVLAQRHNLLQLYMKASKCSKQKRDQTRR